LVESGCSAEQLFDQRRISRDNGATKSFQNKLVADPPHGQLVANRFSWHMREPLRFNIPVPQHIVGS
jgi:hypothetical protein